MPLEDVDFGDLYTYTRTETAEYLGSGGVITSVAADTAAVAWTAAGTVNGFVVEGSTQNLLPNTSDPHALFATLVNATQDDDSGVAPDGTTTATKIIEDVSIAVPHYVNTTFTSSPSITAGANRAWSFFVKANGRTRLSATMFDSGAQGNFVSSAVNLTTGTATGSVGGNGVLVMALAPEAYPNGWYRITLIGTPNPSSSDALRPRVQLLGDDGLSNYIGDGTSGVYLWGHNMHTGLSPRSFIATTTAPKTRGADLCSLNSLETTFEQTQGTFYMKFIVPAAAPTGINRTLFHMDDGTTDNSYDVRIDAGTLNVTVIVRSGAAQVASVTAGAITAGATSVVAFSYTTDAFRISLNGAAAVSDTSGAVPTGLSALYVGSSDNAGAAPLDGVIKRFYRRDSAYSAVTLAVTSSS
jgi:hypothetical protein